LLETKEEINEADEEDYNSEESKPKFSIKSEDEYGDLSESKEDSSSAS